MKHFLLSILVLLFSGTSSFAQTKLTSSRTSGYYTYIYKLSDQEAIRIAEKSRSVINDSFLHTLVDSFRYEVNVRYAKKLPYGNYLYVTAVKNQLNYRIEPVRNVDLRFLDNRKDYGFAVLDLKGNKLNDAEVSYAKGKRISYDQESKLYLRAKLPENTVVTVRHEGVNNYFVFEKEETEKRRRDSRDPVRPVSRPERSKYSGYMIFNKPKYKPLDTVHLKAYVLTAKGAPIKGRVFRLSLQHPYSNDGVNKVLAMLSPYREGGYTHSFVLSDSLKLELDRNYIAVLQEKKGEKWEEVIRNTFRYEDYELKSVSFAMRSDRQSYRPGQAIALFLKAIDENDLAVPDGRVRVNVISERVKAYHQGDVFVPDSLWSKEIKLDPVGETKLLIPDSIFPKADLNFRVDAVFLNSNNERRNASKSLEFERKQAELKAELKKDSVHFDYQENGISKVQKAVIYTCYENTEERDSLVLNLPGKIKFNPGASYYLVNAGAVHQQEIDIEDIVTDLVLSAWQQKDSLRVQVDNPHRIPFWYTVFSDNKVFLRGYTNQLDTLISHTGKKTAHVRLDYFVNEEHKHQETSSMYAKERLQIKLLAPEVVYPGQQLNMSVSVTDVNNQPVAGTDVTALAHTSKFLYSPTVNLPYFGKVWKSRLLNPGAELETIDGYGQLQLDWDRWKQKLGLDTITYYQFSQTKDLFVVREAQKDTMPVVLPVAVRGGKILPVQILYIDGVPVFFNGADQLNRYAFRIRPGKHQIQMRTADYMIHIDEYEFPKGYKTILSVFADPLNDKVRVTAAPRELTEYEASELNRYMIRIEDNFKGDKALLMPNENTTVLLNPPNSRGRKTNILVGPFRENYLNIKLPGLDQHFMKEPGYTYTFLPNLLKQKSFETKYAFSPILTGMGPENYKDEPLRPGEIDSIWTDYLDLRSRTSQLFNNYGSYGPSTGRLDMRLDSSLIEGKPFLKNILIYKTDELNFLHIYPGNTTYFNALEAGSYRMLYLFKDNSYFVVPDVRIKASGLNHFVWKTVKVLPADVFSTGIDQKIKSVGIGNNSNYLVKDELMEEMNTQYFDPKNLGFKMSGRVMDSKKMAMPGVVVQLVGSNWGVTTDAKGYFEIKVPKNGNLKLSFLGYTTRILKVISGDAGELVMEESGSSLNEVVVVGYGRQTKQSMTGSVTTINSALGGRVGGIISAVDMDKAKSLIIRGKNSPTAGKPLVIIDGLPSEIDINNLSADLITEMSILKDADATAIYGSRGANGVIIIKTRGGNMQTGPAGELQEQRATLRTRFSDYAIWQPQLLTDEQGRASFNVTFPDDITKWTTQVIAINSRKQSGMLETSIRSFKTLSANFVSPQFAIAGDSIQVIGKLMNYNNMDEKAIRKFSFNDKELLNSPVAFKNSHIDTVAILAGVSSITGTDSLKFEYSMKQHNGYFDGELRKIPLFQAGVLETKGSFQALLGDTSLSYKFDPALGQVTLRAEASVFPVLLDEIEKLRNYEYLCNEQLASKLKALLLEKTVRKYLGQEFKEEKNIKSLLQKLENNKRPEGTWGWWPNSSEEIWISLHVVETLLEAEKQGYAVKIDKEKLYRYLVAKLAGTPEFDQIHTIRLIRTLHENHYIKDWLQALEQQRLEYKKKFPEYQQPLYEKLQLMQLKQSGGMEVDLKWLLSIQNKTMFGNLYWGTAQNQFWDNSIQNTLLAYEILRKAGGHKAELDGILRYFLEQRKDGQWRNTYESALILKTVLPELIVPGKQLKPASLTINQREQINIFPYTTVVAPDKSLNLSKKGDSPVYFTAYQQFHNPKPEKVSKDFSVSTVLKQNGTVVKQLKAGTVATLEAEIEVRADADYVMIEIPIPAGCSYENKVQSFWGVEAHREYFKHKTSIFCTKLKAGKYHFAVQLLPRYSGNYILNPAKAEMMYFPVFYGREEMKKVLIK